MNIRRSHLFATLWPVLMIFTVYSLAAPFFAPFINLFLLFGLVFAADLCAFYLYRSGSENRESTLFMLLRFFVFSLIAVWIIYKLASGEVFRGIYTPLTAGSLSVLFCCAAGWGLTLFFARALINREKLTILFAPFEKKELAAKTRQYSYELQEMKLLTEKIRLVPLVFTVIAILILLGSALVRGTLYAYQVMTVLILLVFCIAFVFYTRGLDEELLLLSEGIRLDEEWLNLKGRRFFLLLFLLALPALFLCRVDFALPLSLLEDFFSWLGGLFTLEQKEAPPVLEMPRIERNTPSVNQPMMMLGDLAEPREPLFSDRFKEVFRHVLLGTGIGMFILFLIFPFLSRNGRSRGKGLFKTGLREMKQYFSRLGSLIFSRPAKREKREYRRIRAKQRNEGSGQRKEDSRERSVHDLPSANKVLRAFNKLCRWGKKRDLPYETGMSPSDYVRTLEAPLPRRKNDLAAMARFLDSYFYSTRIIDADEIERFIRLVGTILKEERKR